MEIRASSPKPGHSPDFVSDPEEKEISEGEDDDDDRNHKHRRRDTRSQSLERDGQDQILTRPYRKRNRPFENGHTYKEGDSQPSTRFDKRRLAPYPRAPLDPNQRGRGSQFLAAEPGSVRGRGREPGSWVARDPRFTSIDMSSQLIQPGPVPPSLFAGRGLPNVSSNAQSTSWNAFGLVPGLPNGGLDTLHPLGLQGTRRPSIGPSMNIGIPRQRCRDFEERGFCLRGDMCPMEHGVNRIVVEDVQSLSQFNLPVSLPSTQLLGTAAGQGALTPNNAAPAAHMNSKVLQGKNGKHGMTDDGLGSQGGMVAGSAAGGSDVYDPDQPLWTNDHPETSTALLALNRLNADESETLDIDTTDRSHAVMLEGFDDALQVRSAAVAGSHNSSVWGRIGSSKNRSGVREKNESVTNSSTVIENHATGDDIHRGQQVNGNVSGPQMKESSISLQGDSGRSIRKPSQKALRTLFVNGIPQNDNKKDALFSHFQKFGEVIDIYIPFNSERAFVQFSKRDEAEAALKAPDAVMGNRFIRLRWANRDNILDDGISSINDVSGTTSRASLNPSLSRTSFPNKRKDAQFSSGPKGTDAHSSVMPGPVSDHPKPLIATGPKPQPPLQKKLESLEIMREQLRKKQESLDQKRNEFRRQLDKLTKQASGLKDAGASDQAAKRLKGTEPDPDKSETSRSSPRATAENKKSAEQAMQHTSKPNTVTALPEPSGLKHSICPLVPSGAPFIVNRFKLDNRPTAFRITSPLPTGLAEVAVLEEHFSTFGDLSSVELEESEASESNDTPPAPIITARISFSSRRSAERAFLNGKCWQGQNLQFMWLASSNSSKDGRSENPSTNNKPCESNSQPAEALPNHCQTAAASGNSESENVSPKGDEESVAQDKDLKSSSTKSSDEKQSA